MALYFQPGMRRAPHARYNGAVLSEKNLNRNVNSLTAKIAKLKSRSTTPQQSSHPIVQPQGEEPWTEEAKKQAIQGELEDYIREGVLDAATDLSFHTLLSYWKVRSSLLPFLLPLTLFQAREYVFPCLFQLAMTVLAIPATSVPSERVFSSSGRTDTAARNRMSPVLMEALQILKFNHLHNVLDPANVSYNNLNDLEEVLLDEVTNDDLIEAVRRAQNGD